MDETSPEDSTVTTRPCQQWYKGHLRHRWAPVQQGFNVRHRQLGAYQELLIVPCEQEGILALLSSPDTLNWSHREAKHYWALRAAGAAEAHLPGCNPRPLCLKASWHSQRAAPCPAKSLGFQVPCRLVGVQRMDQDQGHSGRTTGCWELRGTHGLVVPELRGELWTRTAHFWH